MAGSRFAQYGCSYDGMFVVCNNIKIYVKFIHKKERHPAFSQAVGERLCKHKYSTYCVTDFDPEVRLFHQIYNFLR